MVAKYKIFINFSKVSQTFAKEKASKYNWQTRGTLRDKRCQGKNMA